MSHGQNSVRRDDMGRLYREGVLTIAHIDKTAADNYQDWWSQIPYSAMSGDRHQILYDGVFLGLSIG